MTLVAAFDWGGTWLRGALIDEKGEILAQLKQRCPKEPVKQLEVVVDLVGRLGEDLGRTVDAVGIGIAGIVRDGRVVSGSNLGLKGVELRSELEKRLSLPVRVANDTQAVALAELSVSGRSETAVFLSVGTGIGGAVVHDGRLFTGRGAAGDFGHMQLAVDGPRCVCGARGCLEQLASGRVLNIVATELGESGRSPSLYARAESGRSLHAGDLDEVARQGDKPAAEALDRASAVLVAGLRCVAAAYDPDRIVLGGGLLGEGSYLLEQVKERWVRERADWTTAELTLAQHGQDAGLKGAALLWTSSPGTDREGASGTRPSRP